MALTGLFLCTFLIVHLIGNLQLFNNDNGMAFNKYAVFMTGNPLIKTISYGLYAIILFHALWGLYLVSENKKARPVAYAMVDGKANSHWTSRWMGVLGTLILVFIVMHMNKFWAEYKFGTVPFAHYSRNMATGQLDFEPIKELKMAGKMEVFNDGMNEHIIVKDLYTMVKEGFKEWWIVLFHVLGMFAISFHLVHGFKSAFQTLGWNHSKYNGLINFLGVWVFGIIIPILFAAMPIYFFLQH